ncbi:MAG: PAS domain S-box protein [Candidatus Omnitrophica bacterium]|nr:PAS domain S-box protein [Candidatus Omnitrophota bacterium]MDD5430282.1 PAS domain S-box protein [Candidatus Omnitrophota bacterium]
MTKNTEKTKEALIKKNEELHLKIAELEIIKQQYKWTEERLRKEKDLTHKYLDIAGVIIVILDRQGIARLINRKGCQILGYKQDEIVGKKWFDSFVPKSVRNEVKSAFEKIIAGKVSTVETYVNPIITKNGQERIIRWHNSFLKDDNGRIASALSSGEDITERRREEEARKQSLELYRSLLLASPNAIIIIDPEGKIIMANQLAAKLSQYERKEQLIGKSSFDFLYPSDIPRAKENLSKVLGGAVVTTEYTFKRKDGTFFLGEMGASLVRDAKGAPRALIGTIRDISERKKSEELLKKKEIEFRLTFENVKDAIFWADPETGMIINCNKAAETLIGRKRGDIIGKHQTLLHPPDKKAYYAKMFKTHLKEKKIIDAEAEILDASGRIKPVNITFSMTIIGNKPLAQGIFRDVSAYRKTQKELLFSRFVIDHMGDAAFWVNPDASMHYVNSAACQLLGYSHKTLLTKKIYDIDVNVLEKFWPRKWKEIKRRKMVKMRTHYCKKGGIFFPVEITANYMGYNGNEYVCAIVRDVTERERIKNALEKIEHDKELILDSVSELVVYHNPRMEIVWTNRAAGKSVGLSPQELSGKHCYRIWHNRKSPCKGCPVKKVFETGMPQEGEIASSDGRFWLIRGYPVKDVSGKVSGVVEVTLDITERRKIEEERQRNFTQSRRILEETVVALAAMAERRDPYTAGHQRRVAQLACAIAQELGLDADRIEGLRMAAIIHDVGKVYVPAEILSKPSRLTELEFSIIKTHPQIGYDILRPVEFPWPVAEIVLQHHEKIDGSGYPNGLKDKEILLESKILTVSDIVEAMASHRPYRAALGIETALKEISKNSSRLYDSQVVKACIRVFKKNKFRFSSKRN